MPDRPIVLTCAAFVVTLACASSSPPASTPSPATCPPISDLSPTRDTGASNAYFAWQTTRMAGVKSRHPLQYPGKPGDVMAWVVVDTAGRAELGTLSFEGHPDQAFSDVVRAFLAAAEFEPAELGPGCPVRMWARMPFVFRP